MKTTPTRPSALQSLSERSPAHSGSATISVPEGHVALVLLQEEASSFYLQIPLDIIGSLCLKPCKYLLFLGWCILGVEGVLALEHDGDGIDTDGNLDDQEIYHYVVAAGLGMFFFHDAVAVMRARRSLMACYLSNEDPVRVVDLEVIKIRTNVPSESTQTRDEFRANLLERDVCCPWTGVEPDFGAGLHIIPYERGSDVRSTIFCWEYV